MLDKEKAKKDLAIQKACEKYDKMYAEYIKECPHSRKDTGYDDWSRIYSVHCKMCGKYLESYL
jgi:transcription elongation factor Elf1